MKDLLFMFDGNPSTYKEFAEDYYEKKILLASIESIYQHKPLTKENGENGKNDEDIVLTSLNNSDINIDSTPVDVASATTEIEVQYNPEKL